MNSTSYLSSLWLWKWLIGAGLSRLPESMATLAFIAYGMHIQSFSFGELLVSIYTFSTAIAATTMGALLDKATAPRRLVIIITNVTIVFHFVLAYLGIINAPLAFIVIFTSLSALIPASLPGLARSLMANTVDEQNKHKIFTWDTISVEITWALGPIIIAALSLLHQSYLGIVAMATCYIGVLIFLIPLVPRTAAPAALITDQSLSIFKHRALWSSFADSLGLGIAETGLISALPILLQKIHLSPGLAGVLVGILAGCSIISAFIYGQIIKRIPWSYSFQGKCLLFFLCINLGTAFLAPNLLLLALAVASAGVCIAPLNTVRSLSLEKSLAAHRLTQGFSTQFALYGLGAAISGMVLATILIPLAALILIGLCLIIMIVGGISGTLFSDTAQRSPHNFPINF